MNKDEFIELESPVIYEHEDEFFITIINSICIDNLKYNQVTARGKQYEFGFGKAEDERDVEIVFDLQVNGYFRIDENGEVID